MLELLPMAHLPASAAACTGAGESWCWAITSAPASSNALAAAFSLGGSYHVRVHTTLTLACGLAAHTPSAKALTPGSTPGVGWAATKPMVLVFVILPAMSPVRYRGSQMRPYMVLTFGASPMPGPVPTM